MTEYVSRKGLAKESRGLRVISGLRRLTKRPLVVLGTNVLQYSGRRAISALFHQVVFSDDVPDGVSASVRGR